MEKRIENHSEIIKIAVTGPESTGKSSLSEQLAQYYNTVWVKEYAREYLEKTKGKYEEEDLLRIAIGQQNAETQLIMQANKMLVSDTEMIVMKIWSQVKYGRCHPELLDMVALQSYDHYLLCNIDLPWEDDPLREHPGARNQLFEMYIKELDYYNFPYTIIKGCNEERFLAAKECIDTLIEKV